MMKAKLIGILLLAVAACTPKSEYQVMLERELASEVRNDSLFLGFHFGMSQKDFYASCWDMNKQGLLIQGPSNLSVEYFLDDELDFPAFMRFYPQFDQQNAIYNMPVEFVYKAYAPWDKTTSSDSLLLDVKDLMEDWYGEGFVFLEDPEGARSVWVKVDGNRRIRIFKRDVSVVAMDISDMTNGKMKEKDG
ncbi:hypothetical protein [Fulvivirga sedimenti]|uniref:Uncharacterized protein n=1 Tax=Fulvivirga sedimenti TaxID=2879465 RepID=A0A9X1HX01_9BACT|nr:hypothetical protein [Fulvivirga sedimenti]MCA6079181.1 hypothetical protein [Fulvivirga sedimenti]